MLVYRGFSRTEYEGTVLTVGNFDGVHLGHRALLARVNRSARQLGLPAAVLTFEPHPREFFSAQTAPARLTTLREKLELLADDGIDLTHVCRFGTAFAALNADEFITRVLVGALRVRLLIVGDDFRFGARRSGDFALLRNRSETFGFRVETMDSVIVDGERVSSSAVRGALQEGRLAQATRLLGRPYAMDGRVVHGNQIGRTLGFATANMRIKHERPPLLGVFAVEVHGLPNGPHRGAANLGYRPSAQSLARPLLEVHLLDFSGDIYGAHLSVRFLHKLRNEMRFDDFSALKTQIAADVEATRAYFQL